MYIWTAGRLGTATFGVLFSVSPPFSFFLAQRWLLLAVFFRFFGLSSFYRSVSRQEVQDGKVSRRACCWFFLSNFFLEASGEKKKRSEFFPPFRCLVFLCCVWVSLFLLFVGLLPSVLQLVSHWLGFFSFCVLHRKKDKWWEETNYTGLTDCLLYSGSAFYSRHFQESLVFLFLFVGWALLGRVRAWAFFSVLFAHVGAAAAT